MHIFLSTPFFLLPLFLSLLICLPSLCLFCVSKTVCCVLRLVQPSVHKLHPATAHLLLHASDIFPHHADGHALLGVLLDRPQSRPRTSLLR